jgi:hypothetical protein
MTALRVAPIVGLEPVSREKLAKPLRETHSKRWLTERGYLATDPAFVLVVDGAEIASARALDGAQLLARKLGGKGEVFREGKLAWCWDETARSRA